MVLLTTDKQPKSFVNIYILLLIVRALLFEMFGETYRVCSVWIFNPFMFCWSKILKSFSLGKQVPLK